MSKVYTKYLQEIYPKKVKLDSGDVIFAKKRLITNLFQNFYPSTSFSNDVYSNTKLQYIYDYYINDTKVSYIKIMEFCKDKRAVEIFKGNTFSRQKKTYWKQKIGYCNPYKYIQ